jgi:hypothetical protein
MIMRPGQQLLLPANPLFIWFSLLLALVVNMLPLGRAPWMPDVLALVVVFWSVHQPLRVGIGVAFAFGLAMASHCALGAALNRPAVLVVPRFSLRLALGEMVDELLFASARVEPAALLASGYRFRHPTVESALRHVLAR